MRGSLRERPVERLEGPAANLHVLLRHRPRSISRQGVTDRLSLGCRRSYGGFVFGFCFALVISAITTPAGVSGAVFLLPVQVSVLEVPSPSVTPTNLLYNVLAIPGALVGFAREEDARWSRRLLVLGAMPGAVIGAVVRGGGALRPRRVPGGGRVRARPAWSSPAHTPTGGPASPRPSDQRRAARCALSLAVGVVGGIYGIGGGSILAPVLVSMGLSVRMVAPAALGLDLPNLGGPVSPRTRCCRCGPRATLHRIGCSVCS